MLHYFPDFQAARTDLYVADSQVVAHIRLTAKEAVSRNGPMELRANGIRDWLCRNNLFQSFSYGSCGHSSGDRDVQGQAIVR